MMWPLSWQAKANFGDDLREELIQTYIASLKKYMPVDEHHLKSSCGCSCCLERYRCLGAYGFRGYFEKTPFHTERAIRLE